MADIASLDENLIRMINSHGFGCRLDEKDKNIMRIDFEHADEKRCVFEVVLKKEDINVNLAKDLAEQCADFARFISEDVRGSSFWNAFAVSAAMDMYYDLKAYVGQRGEKKETYECVCGCRKFFVTKTLISHIAVNVTEEGEVEELVWNVPKTEKTYSGFVCEECGRTYETLEDLKSKKERKKDA